MTLSEIRPPFEGGGMGGGGGGLGGGGGPAAKATHPFSPLVVSPGT